MPQGPGEAAVDSDLFDELMIGEIITLSPENQPQVADAFAAETLTITGLVRSVQHMNRDRVSATPGGGRVAGFAFVPRETFALPGYTDVFVVLDGAPAPFTAEYSEWISEQSSRWAGRADLTLNRTTNNGYASFRGDVAMVAAVARIFPLFFVLVAALVCSTTMTRMVNEEQSQIGALRSLGYSGRAIAGRYALYAGLAAALGAGFGFAIGMQVFPRAIWAAYSMLYGFGGLSLASYWWLLPVCLAVAVIVAVLPTWLACRLELAKAPAALLRPKSPPAGRRILLERITPLWRRLPFLLKISARNVFRYRRRMVMMVLGVAGCLALVITGMGIRDSISEVVAVQYGEVFTWDASATFSGGVTDVPEAIAAELGDELTAKSTLMQTGAAEGSTQITLLVDEDDALRATMTFAHRGLALGEPGRGEILIDQRLAGAFGWRVGDEIRLTFGAGLTEPLTVAGIFDNYVFYYARVSALTFADYFGGTYLPNTVFLTLAEPLDSAEASDALADRLNALGASNVLVAAQVRENIDAMIVSLNYVVLVVIAAAGALALVVMFNLGNINIAERKREIATLKVIGLSERETGWYLFRENAVLTIFGLAAGLPLGVALHRFVMTSLHIDMLSFQVRIAPTSFLAGIGVVAGFAIIVDLVLRGKIGRIDMAEALKSME
ncbi:MAG: ABC transporter permease, partial [Promicromonosporaceae bacterium]|nr:ABC transporter permease [Promicromonosporaceae bacterium]